VGDVSLDLVEGLQLLKTTPGTRKSKGGWDLHKA